VARRDHAIAGSYHRPSRPPRKSKREGDPPVFGLFAYAPKLREF
jgi:hypothetical protein